MKIKRIKEWFQWQWRLYSLKSTCDYYERKCERNSWIYSEDLKRASTNHSVAFIKYKIWQLGDIDEDNT